MVMNGLNFYGERQSTAFGYDTFEFPASGQLVSKLWYPSGGSFFPRQSLLISYYQGGAPSSVETLREIARSPKLELVPKFRETDRNTTNTHSGPEFWDQFQLWQFRRFVEGFGTGWRYLCSIVF